MFEVKMADGRTALADADSPEDLALILEGTGATFGKEISNQNAPIFKTNEAITMRQALRIMALESMVAEQHETLQTPLGAPDMEGLNSDFAQLHDDLMNAMTITMAQRIIAAGAVLSLKRIQQAMNQAPEWNSATMDAVAEQVRAAGLVLLDSDDHGLDEEELCDKYSSQGEHPLFRAAQWRDEVRNAVTRLGYWAWVVTKLDQE